MCLFIRREYLALLVQLRWAMSEPLYVERVITDAHVFLLNIIDMNCKHCNKTIPEDSKFGPYCGGENHTPISNKGKQPFLKDLSLRSILLVIAIGVWILVLQNLGIIPVSQNVKVTNGVEVDGTVRVNNTVDVSVVDY